MTAKRFNFTLFRSDAKHWKHFIEAKGALLVKADNMANWLHHESGSPQLRPILIANELKKVFPDEESFKITDDYMSFYDFYKNLERRKLYDKPSSDNGMLLWCRFKCWFMKVIVMKMLRDRLADIDKDQRYIHASERSVCIALQRCYKTGSLSCEDEQNDLNNEDRGITRGASNASFVERNPNAKKSYSVEDTKQAIVILTAEDKGMTMGGLPSGYTFVSAKMKSANNDEQIKIE